MGCVVSAVKRVAKAVWSGIKTVAKTVVRVVKNVAKAVVKVVKTVVNVVVNGVIKVVEVVAPLVAAIVIAAAVAVGLLGLCTVGTLALSIVFISDLIKFGRSKENISEEENVNDNYNGDQDICADPNINRVSFEDEVKEKKLNLIGDFFEDSDAFYNETIEYQLEKSSSNTYSFIMDDINNNCISKKKDKKKDEVEDSEDDDCQVIDEDLLVSYIIFKYNKQVNLIMVSISNEVNEKNDKLCRKIMETIKKKYEDGYKRKVKYTINEDVDKEVELKDVKNLSTLTINIIL